MYSSFCPLSNKNLAKILISISASFLSYSKWAKELRGKVKTKCLNHVSGLPPPLLPLSSPSSPLPFPSSPGCLSFRSSMPLNKFKTIFSSHCHFQGSEDGPKLLRPLLSEAKPKTQNLSNVYVLLYSQSPLF